MPPTLVRGDEHAFEPEVAVGRQRAVHVDRVVDAHAAGRRLEATERRRREPVADHREPGRVDRPLLDRADVARRSARPRRRRSGPWRDRCRSSACSKWRIAGGGVKDTQRSTGAGRSATAELHDRPAIDGSVIVIRVVVTACPSWRAVDTDGGERATVAQDVDRELGRARMRRPEERGRRPCARCGPGARRPRRRAPRARSRSRRAHRAATTRTGRARRRSALASCRGGGSWWCGRSRCGWQSTVRPCLLDEYR